MKLLIAVLGFVFATPTCDQVKQWCNLDVTDGIYENMEECLADNVVEMKFSGVVIYFSDPKKLLCEFLSVLVLPRKSQKKIWQYTAIRYRGGVSRSVS